MTRDLVLMDCPRHGRVPHDTSLTVRSYWECRTCAAEEWQAEREWLDAQDRLMVGWSDDWDRDDDHGRASDDSARTVPGES